MANRRIRKKTFTTFSVNDFHQKLSLTISHSPLYQSRLRRCSGMPPTPNFVEHIRKLQIVQETYCADCDEIQTFHSSFEKRSRYVVRRAYCIELTRIDSNWLRLFLIKIIKFKFIHHFIFLPFQISAPGRHCSRLQRKLVYLMVQTCQQNKMLREVLLKLSTKTEGSITNNLKRSIKFQKHKQKITLF